MKVGYVLRNSGPVAVDAMRELPRIAEDLGFSTIWLTDHVIGIRAYSPVYEPEWTEIVTSLAYMAGTTTSIRLGTGVLVVPYRDPVLTAKMVSTIDQLSDGRVTLGIGSGWAKAEYGALGQLRHFDSRGAVTDETLDLMLHCWNADGEFDWKGDKFEVRQIKFGPTTVQRPRVPIWVGGQSKPALRRAARIGDAWHPTNIPASEVAALGAELDELAGRAVQRTIRTGISLDDIDRIDEILAEYESAGCTEAALQIRDDDYSLEQQRRQLERLAKRLPS